jgi:hypothetical protein
VRVFEIEDGEGGDRRTRAGQPLQRLVQNQAHCQPLRVSKMLAAITMVAVDL